MPEIDARLEKFVKVRLFTNDKNPAARSDEWRSLLEKRFGTSAIPFYVGLSAGDEELFKTGFPGGTPESFAVTLAEMMDRALERYPK